MALVLDTDPGLVQVALVPNESGSAAVFGLNYDVLSKCLEDVVAAVNQNRQTVQITEERVDQMEERLELLAQSGFLNPGSFPVSPTEESQESTEVLDSVFETVEEAETDSSPRHSEQQQPGLRGSKDSAASGRFSKSSTRSFSDDKKIREVLQRVTDAEELSKKQQADWRELKQTQRTIKESLEAARRQLGGVDAVALETQVLSLLKRQQADEEENEEQARYIQNNRAKIEQQQSLLDQLRNDIRELLPGNVDSQGVPPQSVSPDEHAAAASETDIVLCEQRVLQGNPTSVHGEPGVSVPLSVPLSVPVPEPGNPEPLAASSAHPVAVASDRAVDELRAQIQEVSEQVTSQQMRMQEWFGGHDEVLQSHDVTIKQLQLDNKHAMQRFQVFETAFQTFETAFQAHQAEQRATFAAINANNEATKSATSIAEARADELQSMMEEKLALAQSMMEEKLALAHSDMVASIAAQQEKYYNELQERMDNQLATLRLWLQEAFQKHEAIVRSKAERSDVEFGNEALRKAQQRLHSLEQNNLQGRRNLGILGNEVERVRQLLDHLAGLLEISPGNARATPGPEQGDALLGVQPLRRCLSCNQVVRGTSPLDSVNLRVEVAKDEIFREIQHAVLRSNKEGREAVMQFRCLRLAGQDPAVEDITATEVPVIEAAGSLKSDLAAMKKVGQLNLQGQGWGDSGGSASPTSPQLQSLPARKDKRPNSAPNGRHLAAVKAGGKRADRTITVMDMLKKQ